MLKRVFKLYTTYQQAKADAAEESASVVEKDERPLLGLLFIGFTIFQWVGAITTSAGPVEIYLAMGLTAITVVFVTSYFSFFLGSKIVFKPTAEERDDDTSVLAIFSACERRERRSFISLILAFFHTLIFCAYVISKDQKLLDSLFSDN
ncbi:MAG: hypothetical protein IT173_00035 [Acidobacteria bacterium]|nr:hypothetical protein [Acidobacteriota bacterium]